MNARSPKAFLRLAWGLNLSMLGCLFVAALVVDGNGRILGMSESYSLLLALTLFALGVTSALAMLISCPRWMGKVVGGLSLATYLILAIPALIN